MRRTILAIVLSSTFSYSIVAFPQDAQSLGDVARQSRKQKRENQSAPTGTAQSSKSPKLITNEEIPEHPDQSSPPDVSTKPAPPFVSGKAKLPAEQWRSQIQAQKNIVDSLQTGIDRLNDSIHFAPGNCVAGCVQWNERQKQKQQEVERGQAQLADQKKRLEDMQEAARQQGYGSSVYDP